MKIDGMSEQGAEKIICNEDKEEISCRLEKTM
jgi:hypothetical protein